MSYQDGVAKQGYASKVGGFIKARNKRWFVLEGDELHYCKKPGDKNIKCIKLTEVEEIVFNAKKKNTKAILIRDSKKDNTIIFSTEREALEWYKAIVLAR